MYLEGQIIAGYRLEERVGAGGAAAVYRAYQPQLDRWVAVKVLDVEDAGGQSFLEPFRLETRAVAALHHPNILSIHDYGEDQGIAYIVMEYVAGGSLKQQMQGMPMSFGDALNLALPIADALAYAHAQGIVHRDIKPSNILMARPDWPLIVDFGLAGVVGARRDGARMAWSGGPAAQSSMPSSAASLEPDVTDVWISAGVVDSYLSPEQIVGEEIDDRTDIYSLGLILYQLLAGRFPFPGESAAETLMLRMHKLPESPRVYNPDIPESLEAVLFRALEPNPMSRYRQMKAFVNDLRRVRRKESGRLAGLGVSDTDQGITMRLRAQQEIVGPRLFIATSGVALPLPGLDEVLLGRQDVTQARTPEINLEPYGAGSAGVSRQHARLLHRPDGWYIEDLRSTNGTYINEVRLLPYRPVRIRSGDLIRFAQMTLIFEEA